jgi:hypothetical protein
MFQRAAKPASPVDETCDEIYDAVVLAGYSCIVAVLARYSNNEVDRLD